MNYLLTRTRGVQEVSKTFAEWNIENPRFEFMQQSSDKFTFTISGDAFGAAEFEHGDKIKVQLTAASQSSPLVGYIVFQGKLISAPRTADSSTFNKSYTVFGPWWDLEHLVFCQQWARPNPNFDKSSPVSGENPFLRLYDTTHVFLGQNIKQIFPAPNTDPSVTTEFLNTGQQISEVLAYIRRVEVFPNDSSVIGDFNVQNTFPNEDLRSQQAGSINVSVNIPIQEDRDITCSQAIQKMLKWSPDAVCWYDYKTEPPTLNISTVANGLTVEDIHIDPPEMNTLTTNFVGCNPPFAACGVTTFAPSVIRCELSPRNDLVRPSVVILYERFDIVNDIAYNGSSTDAAGGTGREKNALCATIELTGGVATLTSQSIITQEIPYGTKGSRVTNPDWWVTYCPHLAGLKVVTNAGLPTVVDDALDQFKFGMLIKYVDQVLTDTISKENCDTDGKVGPGEAEPSNLPNQLVAGEIKSWMVDDFGAPIQWERATIRATAAYRQAQTSNSGVILDIEQNTYNKVELDALAVPIIATNAETGTYWSRKVTQPQELAPVGLAQYLYDSFSHLHYEGQIDLSPRIPEDHNGFYGTPNGNSWLGCKINIIGGNPEWETMETVVQGFSVNLDNLSVSIKVGPPEHLGPSDLIDMLRLNRTRAVRGTNSQDGKAQPDADGQSVSAITPPDSSSANVMKESVVNCFGMGGKVKIEMTADKPNVPINKVTEDGSAFPRYGALNVNADAVVAVPASFSAAGVAAQPAFHAFISATERNFTIRLDPGIKDVERRVVIDPSHLLGTKHEAIFREVIFCEPGGVRKKAYVLMTETENP